MNSFKLHTLIPIPPNIPDVDHVTTNWLLCCLCQEGKQEPLIDPSKIPRAYLNAGYMPLSFSLEQSSELGAAPIPRCLNLSRFDEGGGIIQTLITNKAVYHKNCRAQFNKSKLKVAIRSHQKRKHDDEPTGGTNTRSQHLPVLQVDNKTCFFDCGEPLTDKCRRAHTFNLDQRVKQYAIDLKHSRPLDKIATSDMVAFEAVYHPKCLASFYNDHRTWERKIRREQ